MTVSKALERVAIVVASLALSFGLIAVLSGFFAGRDQAGVSGSGIPLGQAFRDQGHAHLRPGSRHPAYDSDPPTSGAHVPVPILRDETQITDDQLLQALELGDVVVMYGTPKAPPALSIVARKLAGPFSRSLAAAGDTIILARRPGTTGLIGLAWAHMVHVSTPTDPMLVGFINYWLGRGAPVR